MLRVVVRSCATRRGDVQENMRRGLTKCFIRKASPGGLPSSRRPGRGARTAQDPPVLRSAAAACPHPLLRADPPNLALTRLGEPDVARVGGPGRDAQRPALGRGDAEKGEAAAGRDAPNVAHIEVRKPEVAIRPGCDALRLATGRGDAPDLAPTQLGEPISGSIYTLSHY
jgi:hypothetical protein